MKRSTLTTLRKLKTTSGGEYVLPEARDAEGYPLLAGYRGTVSPSMGAMTAGGVPISFGDHSRFVKRTVANSFEVKVFSERFAEFSPNWDSPAFGALMAHCCNRAPRRRSKLLTMHA